jgi:hypothetical protein
LGNFLSNLTKNCRKKWKCLFFLLYKQIKQCHNFCIQKTTTFHYSAKALDFVLCSYVLWTGLWNGSCFQGVRIAALSTVGKVCWHQCDQGPMLWFFKHLRR